MEIRRVSGHEGQSRMWNLVILFRVWDFFRSQPWLVSGSGPVLHHQTRWSFGKKGGFLIPAMVFEALLTPTTHFGGSYCGKISDLNLESSTSSTLERSVEGSLL